jgi:hypothetical protein
MIIRQITIAMLAAFLLVGSVGKAAPSAEEIQKATKAVDDKIKELNGVGLLPTQHLADESLEKAFPGHFFFAAHVRRFPVARIVPEGSKIKSQNLFVVKEGKVVQHLTEAKQLEKFFQDTLAPAKDDAARKTATRAWLALAPEFMQDGFFKFKIVDDAIKVDSKKGTGTVVVMAGGSGEITSTVNFDDAGKLVSASDAPKVRPGPRPICQATKLLDADPIVRKMAEQDLLIMGRAAHGYLMEQRAKAAPDLQQAIDRLWQRILSEDK